jgi:lactoylglutathione lyase
MMIKRIAHLAFGVKDMKKTLHFYTEVMGFEKAFTLYDPNDSSIPWIEYIKISDSNFIEFFYSDPVNAFPKDEVSYQHFCLETDDIHAFVKRMNDYHYPIDSPISMGLDNNWQCWIKDPDGNRIEIMQYGPNSLQLH